MGDLQAENALARQLCCRVRPQLPSIFVRDDPFDLQRVERHKHRLTVVLFCQRALQMQPLVGRMEQPG